MRKLSLFHRTPPRPPVANSAELELLDDMIFRGTDDDLDLARNLSAFLSANKEVRLTTPSGSASDFLSSTIRAMLLRGLQGIQYGLAVQVDSWREELTLLEVADILKTSRPFVVHLVQTGVLPTHPGKGRERVWIADVVAYRRRLRNQALNQVDIEDEGPESTGERAGEGDPASEI